MNEDQFFWQLDIAIESFLNNENIRKNIWVSKETHNDWLKFQHRQLIWYEKDITYLIETFPSFKNEDIVGWNISAAAYFDENDNRFYLKKPIVENISANQLLLDAINHFKDAYSYLNNIIKDQIPQLPTRI